MTIGIRRLLLHMGWANRFALQHLKSLPDDALEAFATNAEWTVAEIIYHIVDSADFYYYRITGEWADVPGDEITKPASVEDLDLLAEQCEAIDRALVECANLDDVKIQFERDDGEVVRRWRSTILSQTIHHATEHRAQIAAALEARGFNTIALDDIDLWGYEIETENGLD